LGAAVAVQAAEIPCGEGVFAKLALERAEAVHHFDGVMSHSFNCRLSSMEPQAHFLEGALPWHCKCTPFPLMLAVRKKYTTEP
jgi:hypothetical protein